MAQVRRTRNEWTKLVAEWRASGNTCKAFCSRRGIKPGRLKWWAWTLASDAKLSKAPVSFVPVRVSAQVAPNVVMFDLEVRDVRFRFEGGTDPRYVAALARAIERDDGTW